MSKAVSKRAGGRSAEDGTGCHLENTRACVSALGEGRSGDHRSLACLGPAGTQMHQPDPPWLWTAGGSGPGSTSSLLVTQA